MAFVLNQPHPAWVAFLTIPLAEWLVWSLSHWWRGRKRHQASAESAPIEVEVEVESGSGIGRRCAGKLAIPAALAIPHPARPANLLFLYAAKGKGSEPLSVPSLSRSGSPSRQP